MAMARSWTPSKRIIDVSNSEAVTPILLEAGELVQLEVRLAS